EEWRIYCKSGRKISEIPAAPNVIYKEQWKGWSHWLGYSNKKRNWTDVETELILSNKNRTAKWISEKTGRTIASIHRCRRILGLCKSNHRRWSKEEIEFIKHNMDKSVAFISKELGRSEMSIYKKLSYEKRNLPR